MSSEHFDNICMCLCLSTASNGLGVEQRQIQQMALDFAANELAPNMIEWDEKVLAILHDCVWF